MNGPQRHEELVSGCFVDTKTQQFTACVSVRACTMGPISRPKMFFFKLLPHPPLRMKHTETWYPAFLLLALHPSSSQQKCPTERRVFQICQWERKSCPGSHVSVVVEGTPNRITYPLNAPWLHESTVNTPQHRWKLAQFVLQHVLSGFFAHDPRERTRVKQEITTTFTCSPPPERPNLMTLNED